MSRRKIIGIVAFRYIKNVNKKKDYRFMPYEIGIGIKKDGRYKKYIEKTMQCSFAERNTIIVVPSIAINLAQLSCAI